MSSVLKINSMENHGFPDLIPGQIFSSKGKKILTVWNNPGEELVEYHKKWGNVNRAVYLTKY